MRNGVMLDRLRRILPIPLKRMARRVLNSFERTIASRPWPTPTDGPSFKVTRRRLSRPAQLFTGIDVTRSNGLEIGALDRPVTLRENGSVWYADYCSTEQLRTNHKNTATVDVARIVDVDFVAGDERLSIVVPLDLRFDYVVASHVAEHIPDLITWLADIRSVLKPGGKVRLIIPNKEACFDRRRTLSEERDLIAAFVEQRRKPSPIHVYDFYRWHDQDGALVHSMEKSFDMARQSQHAYVDTHCWVFTPASFARIMTSLIEGGFIPFELEFVTATPPGEIDFFVGFR